MADVVDIIQRITYESNTDVIEALNKAFGNQFKQIQDLETEQKKLSAIIEQTNEKDIAQKNALNIALQKNKQQIDAITASIGKQFAENERLNKSVVATTRNFGNLSFAFSQILREAPSAAIGIQTFFLAISNNLPILLDELKAARAQGASTVDIFKTLGQSLFSLNGIITLSIAAVTIFGDRLFKGSKEAQAAAKSNEDYAKSLDSIDESAQKSATSEIARLQALASVASNTAISLENRNKAVDELQKKFPSYLGNLDKERILNGDIATEIENISKALIARSLVEAAQKKLGESSSRLLDLLRDERKAINDLAKADKALEDTREAAKPNVGLTMTGTNSAVGVAEARSALRKKELDNIRKDREGVEKEQKQFLDDIIRFSQEAGDLLFDTETKKVNDLTDAIHDLMLEYRKFYLQSITFTGRTAPDRGEALPLPSGIIGNMGQATDEERRGFADAERLLGGGILTAEQLKKQNEAKEKARNEEAEKIKNNQKKIVGYYQDAAQSILGTFKNILDARTSLLDTEISITQSRIQAATELAQRGNTEVLESELANLNRLQEEREKMAQRQLAINSLLQASSSALAVAQSLQTISQAGAFSGPAAPVAIAATVAALAAGFSLIAGLATSIRGFSEGGYTGVGGKHDIAGIVHKDEFVFSKERTREFGVPFLESLHSGGLNTLAMVGTENRGNNRSLERKMDVLTEAVKDIYFKAENRVDSYGVHQMVQTTLRREQNKWK